VLCAGEVVQDMAQVNDDLKIMGSTQEALQQVSSALTFPIVLAVCCQQLVALLTPDTDTVFPTY